MNKWFKVCIILTVVGSLVLLLDLHYWFEIESSSNYWKVNFLGYHPTLPHFIALFAIILLLLIYPSFLMEAKPVLNRELLGKKNHR